MISNTLLALLGAVGFASAIETHGGIQFDVRWTNTSTPLCDPIKDAYETVAAQNAYRRLKDVIQASNITTDCFCATDPSPSGLYALKDCLAAEKDSEVFFDLLAEDIAAADTFWKKVVEQSSIDLTAWIPARTYVRGYFGDCLTATEFAVWTASPFANAADLHANPEHYFIKSTATSATAQSSEIFEGWGGVLSSFGTVRTNFTVPDFAPPAFGSAAYPWAWSLSTAFTPALQRIGHKALKDGTTFGVLHIAARDFAAGETSVGVSGVEVYAAVWYPAWDLGADVDRTEFGVNFLRDEAHHMVQEIIFDTLRAMEDCETGLCAVHS